MKKRNYFSHMTALLRVSVLLIIMSVVISGCGKSKKTTNETTTTQSDENRDLTSDDAIKEQEKFDELTDSIFYEEIVLNTLNLHYTLSDIAGAGIDSYDITLGDISKDQIEKDRNNLSSYLDELTDIDYNLLTDEQQLTYDITYESINDSLSYDSDKFYLLDEYLSPLNGMQQMIPTLLADYTFSTEQDITDYLKILEILPAYYDQILSFEQEKSDAGLFMHDFEADEVIEQCNDFIADPDNHFMILTFNEKINSFSGLDEAKKSEYIAKNAEIFKSKVVPSYTRIIETITNLKSTTKNLGGLCNIENGKEYYETLVKDYTGSSKSIEEIKALIQKNFKSDLSSMITTASLNPDSIDTMYDYPMDVTNPENNLKDLQSKITEDFPKGPDTTYTVKSVPASMEKFASPAYFLVPQIDNYTNNVIYINNYSESGENDLYSTLAHEGFPGHLYQVTYFKDTNPSKIRSLFSFGGYDEGWATYAELYSYDISGKTDACAKLCQVETTYSFGIYCLADIGINYEGWTLEDTENFCSEQGLDSETAKKIYQTMIEEPGLYLKYYLGYLEISSLKDKAQDALGNDFDIKEFHKFLLDIGPAEFDIIDKYLDKWIGNN